MDKHSIDQLQVAVILCAYNDKKNYLSEQLDSIRLQTHQNITVYIFDDSTDQLVKNQVTRYKTLHKLKIVYRKGLQKGFAVNFINGICQADNFDFYFLSDQDDYWLPNKVRTSLRHAWKTDLNKDFPFLYGSKTTGVDQNLKFIRHSPLQKKKLSFNNALVQNFAGGNTFCFNKKLCSIIKSYGVVDVPFHDWWIYILNSAYGGTTIYDKNSYILYRQDDNVVGINNSLICKIKNFIKKLFFNQLRNHIDVHIDLLLKRGEIIKYKETYKILLLLSGRYRAGYLNRLVKVIGLKLYAQSNVGNFCLLVLIIFNKV